MKFGYLTPLEWLRGGFWKCKCDCGNETIVDTRNLTTGHTQSCGCARRETKNVFDMNGYEDENLRVISRAENVGEIAAWNCVCKHCGRNFTTKGSNIRNRATTSCGCVNVLYDRKPVAPGESTVIEFELDSKSLSGWQMKLMEFYFADKVTPLKIYLEAEVE